MGVSVFFVNANSSVRIFLDHMLVTVRQSRIPLGNHGVRRQRRGIVFDDSRQILFVVENVGMFQRARNEEIATDRHQEQNTRADTDNSS